MSPHRTDRVILKLKETEWQNYNIIELENGSIEVYKDNCLITPSKPALRDIAKTLLISTLNSNGNQYNTRQLGSLIIKTINNI